MKWFTAKDERTAMPMDATASPQIEAARQFSYTAGRCESSSPSNL